MELFSRHTRSQVRRLGNVKEYLQGTLHVTGLLHLLSDGTEVLALYE